MIEHVLERFTQQIDEKYNFIIGRFRRELTHPERTQETELGNLFADIFTESLGVDIMLIGSGSIRSEKLGPIVTYADLIEGFPYDDGVYSFVRYTQELLHILEMEILHSNCKDRIITDLSAKFLAAIGKGIKLAPLTVITETEL